MMTISSSTWKVTVLLCINEVLKVPIKLLYIRRVVPSHYFMRICCLFIIRVAANQLVK